MQKQKIMQIMFPGRPAEEVSKAESMDWTT